MSEKLSLSESHLTLSLTPLLKLSKLPLTKLLLLLRRLLLLVILGSFGFNPLARANRFNTSVKLTTPDNLPDMCCPGSEAAEIEGAVLLGWNGGVA